MRKLTLRTIAKSKQRPNLILHVLGLTLVLVGGALLLSALVELTVGDTQDWVPLLAIGATSTIVGYFLQEATYISERIARIEVFAAVTISWVVMSLIGSLPYLLTKTFTRFDNALFESISGLSTTGATVLQANPDNPIIFDASKGILLWRSLSQWIGGMGVIVLIVAILPALGNWGMGLLQAEAPGPTGERLTPRVRHTARKLWVFYLGFTVAVSFAYLAAGMDFYEAATHGLTTVSTGGFSIYTKSMGHFDSALIEWIAISAMFIAGASFSLLYKLIFGKPGPLLRSIEFRVYCLVVLVAVSLTFLTAGAQHQTADGLRNAFFSVTSIVSTTGYGTVDFVNDWTFQAQSVLFFLLPLGGMAGSTSGGVKLVRVLTVGSFARREIMNQLHPGLKRPIRIGKIVVDNSVASQVLGFFILTLAIFGGGALLISLSGEPLLTAFSASATSLGNVGPGFEEIGPSNDFTQINPIGRAFSMVAMLLGRLEIYPIIVALTRLPRPSRRLWRRITTSRIQAS